MKQPLRLLCLMLCAVMMWGCLPLSRGAEAAEDSAPSIRVNLRRLNLTDRADLTLQGAYTVETASGASMAFPRGSKVTVQLREGSIYVYYSGMSLLAGSGVRFLQNDDGAEAGGLRFSGADGLYPGDLTLTVSGAQLLPVLTLSVEDYLLGVVPYEMSDSFPLEALKAQAVCARTYALSHVNPSAAWDVVDTTNDQVFRGVNNAYQNAARAVRETAGVVGMYKGSLATCFYSASNGGQTELVENVWSGRGDWAYYVMQDDPYDLENPESLVRRARLRKDASGLSDEFVTLLCNYLAPTMQRLGYVPDPAMFRVDSIESVTLGTPGHEAPSRYLTEMTVALRWSGKKLVKPETAAPAPSPQTTDKPAAAPAATATGTATPAPLPTPAPVPTPAPEPVYSDFIPYEAASVLTLPLFPDVSQALRLSLNSGTNNELITLTETEDTYVLESRRYGHGVGMSQRGAQWMAGQYGQTFDQILSFYYPGMTLMVAPSGPRVLPTMAPNLAATPGPAATPTPRPTLMPVTGQLPQGAYLASVEGVEDNSSLNLRAEPSLAADILMRLYKHQQLVVLEACEEPGWVHVKTDSAEGYVMLEFLERVEEKKE